MTSSTTSDLESWLRLALAPRVGPIAQRRLLEQFGSPAAALAATRQALAQALGNGAIAGQVGRADATAVTAALEWSRIAGHHIVTFDDARYPHALREIHDPPPLLYAHGRTELLNASCLAIVGSRNPTPQGMRDAEAFARALSEAGLCIVSGMALGIDAAAHRGGLAGASSSIGILGTGADRAYPPANAALYERLAADGCLVSEFPLGTPPHTRNFPRRNRLISGMSRGVLVVEAATQSGSLITAREALDQGRDVFAIPGSIHAPLAKGCHSLIKQGAVLVEAAADVLEALGCHAAASEVEDANERAPRDAVLRAIGHASLSIDQLVALTGLAAPELAAHLARLEMRGSIASLPGGRFQRAGSPVIE